MKLTIRNKKKWVRIFKKY